MTREILILSITSYFILTSSFSVSLALFPTISLPFSYVASIQSSFLLWPLLLVLPS